MIVWRCSPDGLRPGFRADVDAFLRTSPFTWYVTSAFRSMEEQRALWMKHLQGGPKAAPPGKSAHNYGLAVDVVLDADPATPGLQPSWDIKLAGWGWLKAASIKHPRLQNGWSFGDWPHIQRYKWQQFTSQEAA